MRTLSTPSKLKTPRLKFSFIDNVAFRRIAMYLSVSADGGGYTICVPIKMRSLSVEYIVIPITPNISSLRSCARLRGSIIYSRQLQPFRGKILRKKWRYLVKTCIWKTCKTVFGLIWPQCAQIRRNTKLDQNKGTNNTKIGLYKPGAYI